MNRFLSLATTLFFFPTSKLVKRLEIPVRGFKTIKIGFLSHNFWTSFLSFSISLMDSDR